MKGLILIFSVFCSFFVNAQDEVNWTFSFDKESNTVVSNAVIGEGWHLYSQNVENEFGPVPTTFEYVPNENYTLVGVTEEPQPIVEYDVNFEEELHFFKNEVEFRQKIELKESTAIEGTVTYMVCNDTMCMPPVDVEFTIIIN